MNILKYLETPYNFMTVCKEFIDYPCDNKSKILESSLINACIRGHLEIVKYLSLNYDKHITSHDYDVAMHRCCEHNRVEELKCIVDKCTYNYLIEAMTVAVQNGHLEVLKLIQEHLEDEWLFHDIIPLACEHGKLDIVKYATETTGFNIDDDNFNLGLVNAVENKDFAIANYLFSLWKDQELLKK